MSDLLMADLFFCSLHCCLCWLTFPAPINRSTNQPINQSTKNV